MLVCSKHSSFQLQIGKHTLPQLDCLGGICFGTTTRASANGCFSLLDPVSERRVGEQDSAPAQEKPTSLGRAAERKVKDDSRRVAKSTQDLSDVCMDEVGIPLRVRVRTWESFLGFVLSW